MTPSRLATTAEMIEDVRAAQSKGYMDSVEASRLEDALRRGDITHPIWEDYNLKTNPSNGRAMA